MRMVGDGVTVSILRMVMRILCVVVGVLRMVVGILGMRMGRHVAGSDGR